MALCPAFESSWVNAKVVMPCTAVAARTPAINSGSKSARCLLITSSMSNFGDHGSTSPDMVFTTMRTKPPTSSQMRGRTSAQTSGQTAISRFKDFFFLTSSAKVSLDPEVIRLPRCYCLLEIVFRLIIYPKMITEATRLQNI